MADTEVRITLRLPEALRDRLTNAAEMNNRSMNGEIVERLLYTFEGVDKDLLELHEKIADLEDRNSKLASRVDEALRQNAKSSHEWEEWVTRQFTDENTIYLLLDADGLPLSWDEIMAHVRAISQAAGGSIDRLDVGVVDTSKVPSDTRTMQWKKLLRFYRSKIGKAY